MKKRKMRLRRGSKEEQMMQFVRDVLSTMPTDTGVPVSGIAFIDEDEQVEERLDFKDIPPTKKGKKK